MNPELLGKKVRPKLEPAVNDDSRLIEATLAGDANAFGLLVRRYQDRLFNTLVHVTGSREDAEDVVQDTFVQAYTKLTHFQQRASFYTWMYRIAFNLWVSRRRRRRPQLSVDVGREVAGLDPVSALESPLRQLERQECIELIRRTLSTLDEQTRTILVLREMDGCCYDEIAAILELPVGTIRSRLHRARLQLKRHLEEVLKEQA
jgi:RNA polymerase sigma-70 factor, ECF subfamily